MQLAQSARARWPLGPESCDTAYWKALCFAQPYTAIMLLDIILAYRLNTILVIPSINK